jgi:hypothetical protein
VAIVSRVVAFAIWLGSWVINVDTKITEERGAKVVEIANKRVPQPYRFRFWLRLRASSARIQGEDSAMSLQLGRLI